MTTRGVYFGRVRRRSFDGGDGGGERVGGDALHRDVSSPRALVASPQHQSPPARGVHPRGTNRRGKRPRDILQPLRRRFRPHREHRRVHARAASRRARRTAVRTRADDGGASTPSRRRVPHETHHGVQAVAVVHRWRASFADGQREHRVRREPRVGGVRGGEDGADVFASSTTAAARHAAAVVEPDASNRAATRVGETRDRVGGSRGRGGGGGAEERVDGSVGDEDGVGRGLDGVRAVGSRGAADGGVGVGDDAPAFRDGTGLVEGEDRVASLGVEDERPGGSGGLASRVAEMAVEGDGYPRQPFVRGRFARRAAARARLRTPIRRPDHLRRVRSATGHGLRANTCQTRAIADCPPPGVSPSGKLGSSEENPHRSRPGTRGPKSGHSFSGKRAELVVGSNDGS